MEVKDKRSTREALVLDIKSLSKLVNARHDWLSKPENRKRRTYQAVAEDTRTLERRLQELKEENLNEINRENQLKNNRDEAKR
ncbi:hypothetical protein [uncultured Acetobacteroides sp.]|uniref:hypothetical protein n=1 Tax=uncultured Acetobacteroides sp. TaxID=1760811 RepID=UPI0029F5B600|nr:hypothetical protein [uncultured Acetobacteroides sp.]